MQLIVVPKKLTMNTESRIYRRIYEILQNLLKSDMPTIAIFENYLQENKTPKISKVKYSKGCQRIYPIYFDT